MDKKMLDLDLIAKECGFNSTDSSDVIISKISTLENNYSEDELIQIYNYFLTCFETPKVLMFLIQCSDKYRDSSSLGCLVDLLLLKGQLQNTTYEPDDLINLRV